MNEIETATPRGDKLAVQPATSAYMADRRFLAGGAEAVLERFAHYPEAIREDGIWLHFFCRTKCNSEHAVLYRIAKAIGLRDRSGKEPSDQYWYQVAGGHYFKTGGDAQTFKRYVAALRAYAARMEERGSIPFIETKNWHLLNDYINSRRSFASSTRFGAIEGETGSQKTQCARHYEALNNHKETVHLESPSRTTRARMVQKLAARYLEAASSSVGEKELAIEDFLKGVSQLDPASGKDARPRCIILDNVQRLFRPNIAPDQQPVFTYFHELQEETGCCVIFTWVPTFRHIITAKDPFWKQFLGRIGGEDEILRLEQTLPRKDLLAFARAFKVADDAACLPLLKKWGSTDWGIRILIHKLEKARALASARRSLEITAAHLHAVDLEPVSIANDEEDAS